jgi:hypothetical protein
MNNRIRERATPMSRPDIQLTVESKELGYHVATGVSYNDHYAN